MQITVPSTVLAAFSGLSAILLVAEFSTQRSIQNGEITHIDRPFYAISNRAIQQTLLACDHALSAPFVHLQPALRISKTASTCNNISARVLRWQPTRSLSHLVAAQAAQASGDLATRDSSLTQSQAFAPFEGWLAEHRIGLLVNQRQWIFTKGTDQFKADLSTLLQTQSGAELLSKFYLRHPTIRTSLYAAAQNASLENQTRFLNQLRSRQAKK
jgi:hypothetical protein